MQNALHQQREAGNAGHFHPFVHSIERQLPPLLYSPARPARLTPHRQQSRAQTDVYAGRLQHATESRRHRRKTTRGGPTGVVEARVNHGDKIGHLLLSDGESPTAKGSLTYPTDTIEAGDKSCGFLRSISGRRQGLADNLLLRHAVSEQLEGIWSPVRMYAFGHVPGVMPNPTGLAELPAAPQKYSFQTTETS